jgi:hypothetical protein
MTQSYFNEWQEYKVFSAKILPLFLSLGQYDGKKVLCDLGWA